MHTRRLALLLLTLGAAAPSEGRAAAGEWEWLGFAVEDSGEWFSLKDPQGHAMWLRRGAPGAVRVQQFDREQGRLRLVDHGQERDLVLNESRLGSAPLDAAPALPADLTRELVFPPLPSPDADDDSPRSRFARSARKVQFAAAVARVERAEALRARRADATTTPTPAATPSTDQDADSAKAPRAASGEADWTAIYRRVAERRALEEQREAERKARREAESTTGKQ